MPLTNTHPPSPISVDAWRAPAFAGVLEALLAEQEPIYVVGGAVRDFLLGRDAGLTDLDLALAGPVLPLARRVADRLGWAYYPLDAGRDVARIVQRREGAPPLVCDLAALRGDLAQDLALRDFTVNALALQMTADGPPRLIDRCDGVGDLHRRQIRAVTRQSLAADPIRSLRALRFAAQLGFTLAEQTAAQILNLAPQVTQTSPERQRDELWKLLGLSRPGDGLASMQRLGLLAYVLPEAAALDQVEQSPPHRLDVLQHTQAVMNCAAALRDWLADRDFALPDRALEEALAPWREQLTVHFVQELASGRSRAAWLVWHALFHDTGKPTSVSVEIDTGGARRVRFFGHAQVSANMAERRSLALRFSRREAQIARTVAAAHMRPHDLRASFADGAISRRACYRFFRDTATGGRGDRSGLDVLLLALADSQAPGKAGGAEANNDLAGIVTLLDYGLAPETAAFQPLVDGGRLMRELGLSPGKNVGFLLESIREAQAAGEVTTEEEALDLAAELLAHRDGWDQENGD